MLDPAGSPIFFLRKQTRSRVEFLSSVFKDVAYAVIIIVDEVLLYIFHVYSSLILDAPLLYHLSMTYITVYNLSFNSHCRILAAQQN